jgi:hypothetical protein
MNRDRLVWSEIVHNSVHEVPSRFVSVLGRYFWEREALAGNGREGDGS